MKKLLKIIFIVIFFTAFTPASSNSFCEQNKMISINIIDKSSGAEITVNEDPSMEIHPLNIFAFRFN